MINMDLYKLMENRRSIRDFSKKTFPKEKLETVLKAALLSPSGANQKPFSYVVLDDIKTKKIIKKTCESIDKKYYSKSPDWFKEWIQSKNISLDKNFLVDAPYLVVVSGEIDKPYWLESTWLSIAYFILAAENECLGTLTYTPADMKFLIELLELPKGFEPVVIIPIGLFKP